MNGGGGKDGGKVGMGVGKSSAVATKKEEAKGGTGVNTPKVDSAGAVATGAAAAAAAAKKESDAIQAAVKAGNINIHREERE